MQNRAQLARIAARRYKSQCIPNAFYLACAGLFLSGSASRETMLLPELLRNCLSFNAFWMLSKPLETKDSMPESLFVSTASWTPSSVHCSARRATAAD